MRKKKLKEELNLKEEFLDNLSHEMKISVHNISNIISVLHEQWDIIDTLKKKELIETLKICSNNILNLCSNLLELSKYRKGKLQLSIKKHDIIDLIKKVIQEYSYNQNQISIKICSKLNKIVFCDSYRISQVVRNLIDNSLKYAQGSPITIEIVNYGTRSVKISVSDNGPCIHEKEYRKNFNPFLQNNIEGDGHGLGLIICKKIIEMHMGIIGATNNRSYGTSLYFIIPNEI